LDGKSIGELRLRKETGASIIAIRRGTSLLTNPGADTTLHSGDMVILLGDTTQVTAAVALLNTSRDILQPALSDS
jgi:K+/H+ antiporter YhaU regulatory subunit KhtT